MDHTQHHAPLTFLQQRRADQAAAKAAADAASAARQAGPMTRAERDALRPERILVPSPRGSEPYADPIKAAIKAHRHTMRAAAKTQRRTQNRGR